MKYKLLKVFDCQDFPKHIKDVFFSYTSNHHIHWGNDCCIEFDLTEWHHMGKEIFEEEYGYKLTTLFNFLGDELLGQESILIKHWW